MSAPLGATRAKPRQPSRKHCDSNWVLKLTPGKAEVPAVVVDSISEPGAN